MALTKAQTQAAREFAIAAANAFQSDGNLHPGTTVAGAARTAGTMLYRTFPFAAHPYPPGEVVLSEEANTEGPALLGFAAQYLTLAGISLEGFRADAEVPPRHRPTLPFLETQRRLEPEFNAIRERNGLGAVEAAHAAAVATGIVIQIVAKVMEPHVGLAIAAFAFVEGTKTAPAPLG